MQHEAGTGPHTVLVVEDEPPVRELVTDFLRGEGYEVAEASDGAEAIRALATYRPPTGHFCGVLLDMMLPRVDGVGVLLHLAESGVATPVVAMSASGEHLVAAAAAGAKATLAKPFDLDHLLAVVARYCPCQPS